MKNIKVGILAFQGAFREHRDILKQFKNVETEFINKSEQIHNIDGIIIPGGESTVISKLLLENNMFDDLREKIENKLPVFGTCAGLIMLANNIFDDNLKILKTMDISVKRNAYGSQKDSFCCQGFFLNKSIPMIFIRAPLIKNIGKNVQVLSKINNNIVAARQDNQLVTSFHPELAENLIVHKYFLDMILKNNDKD